MANSRELDMAEFLSTWYIPETTYADRARKIGENAVEVDYLVKEYHCDPLKKPSLRGEIVSDGNVTTNTFVIDGTEPAHTRGHLRNMRLFQGHLADGTLIETAKHDRSELWLVGFRTITHSEPGVPKDKLIATTTVFKEENGIRFVRGNVVCEERVHTRSFDMKFEGDGPSLPADGFYLSQHPLFEIGAHAGGAAVALLREDLIEGDKDPIFASIGPSILRKVIIRPEDLLTSRTTLNRVTDQGAFYADVVISRGEEVIANLGNLGIGFLPHEMVKEIIDGLQHKE